MCPGKVGTTAGNRTPVSGLTLQCANHYTTEVPTLPGTTAMIAPEGGDKVHDGIFSRRLINY